jgi:hypothetical protein
MRNVINTIANVTTSGISRNQVRTVTAGVDAVRASLHLMRLYAAPAPKRWGHPADKQAFAGKQQPAGTGPSLGGSDLLSRSCRESSRCRRPRESSCLARS